jgi:hypothetical protein
MEDKCSNKKQLYSGSKTQYSEVNKRRKNKTSSRCDRVAVVVIKTLREILEEGYQPKL